VEYAIDEYWPKMGWLVNHLIMKESGRDWNLVEGFLRHNVLGQGVDELEFF